MDPVRFGPARTSLAPALVFLVCTVPLSLSSARWSWTLLLPLAAVTWVLRARVVVQPEGLQVCNGLGARQLAWGDLQGFDVPRRGPVRALTPGGRLPLTAVPRREVPALLRACTAAATP